jgi:hypothetical protein
MPEKRTLKVARPEIFHRTAEPEAAPTAAKKQKATFYLPPETVKRLKTVQFEEYQNTGRQPDLSELVDRAIGSLTPR